MRAVKSISTDRMLAVAHEFIATGFERAVVNRTPSFDLEPTEAWGGGGRGDRA